MYLYGDNCLNKIQVIKHYEIYINLNKCKQVAERRKIM